MRGKLREKHAQIKKSNLRKKMKAMKMTRNLRRKVRKGRSNHVKIKEMKKILTRTTIKQIQMKKKNKIKNKKIKYMCVKPFKKMVFRLPNSLYKIKIRIINLIMFKLKKISNKKKEIKIKFKRIIKLPKMFKNTNLTLSPTPNSTLTLT